MLNADPYAWFYLLPLLAGLVWFHVTPPEHAARQAWQNLKDTETEGWSELTGTTPPWLDGARRLEPWLFWAALCALAIAAAASFGAWMGWLGTVA
jgi:hypothetical protein